MIRPRVILSTLFIAVLAAAAANLTTITTATAAQVAERPLDFSRDIRPILSDRCFACHGPDDNERKARLRLDHRDDAIRPAKSGAAAIVPGDPSSSELIKRLATHDPDDIMPPEKTGKKVSPEQIELFRRWIAQGAPYREHWSFIPPEKPPVPASEPGPVHPIDAFIADRLRQAGLQPAPEADRTTLVRRATLDLTGLPPSPEEVDAFLADSSPKAYEHLVDRLLESPRYGERMAVDWLDAARYADTHGYHLDSGRDMTAWRDWVIRAFNDNKPFDEFTVEQLAGDLLPDATLDQKIASGFNRNHMINYEGGAIADEYQYAYLVDRVNTTATVWLGLTMACSQCHDHKYDPISNADYYRFLAFFNNVPERGLDGNRGNAAPTLKLATPEQKQRLADLNQAVSDAEKSLADSLPAIDAAQVAWEDSVRENRPAAWIHSVPKEFRSSEGAEFKALEDSSILVTGANSPTDSYTLAIPNPLTRATALQLEVLPDPSLSGEGPGRSANGNFVLSTVQVDGADARVALKSASADFSQPEFPIAHTLDSDPASGWGIHGETGKRHAAVFEFAEPVLAERLTLTLKFQSIYPQHAIGRFRVSLTGSATPHPVEALPEEIRTFLAIDASSRTPDQQKKIRQHYRDKVSPEYRQRNEAVAAARKSRDDFDRQIPSTMVMAELDKPRDTFIRMRGAYDQLGEKVTAGTPVALPPLPQGEPLNRLGLARWLVAPNHPLTARVAVNRLWQMFFGTGLVKTAEDFGSQGDWPSHPALLDWLAREFVDSGWNVKKLQRLILTSATYRQSSRAETPQFESDPENRLLARGARFRLQAEFIRDQALVISGLLNGVIGGKSVSPYQPLGLWEELSMREDSRNFSAQFFELSEGEDLYRRSMYTFWKRSSPPPQMSTFDAPDRETCTVRRPRTNTPLQALVLLNDPTYIEASRKLAERLLNREGTDADRVAWAFRLATARMPSAGEKAILLRVLEQQRAHYRANRQAAEELLTTGEAPRDLTLDPAELAAWTLLSSTIFNLDETVTKG
ncbi:MAG: PSD1 and planctomycete cytochrome C domain-containing protein [Limisphaerales bacterium]